MQGDVPGGVIKVIEVVGSSTSSFSDAVRNAVRVAGRTIRNIRGVDVLSSSAEVGPDGDLVLYKVDCKIAFLIEGTGEDIATMAASEEAGPPYAESGAPDLDR